MGLLNFDLRAAATDLLRRYQWARQAGFTFNGLRDTWGKLGYPEMGTITIQDFLDRFERGGIASRIIELPPNATWRGEMWLEEDENPEKETVFETAWTELEKRLAIRERFLQLDTLQRLSTYAVLLLGTADGDWSAELPKGKPENLLYLQPYLGGGGPGRPRPNSIASYSADATIAEYDEDTRSPRFGLPKFYSLRRTDFSSDVSLMPIHWTRIIHVAEGTLRDDVFGLPALERVWNYILDLDKVVGGGSEAFWLRCNAGLHMNVDKEMQIATPAGTTELEKMAAQAEEYQHQLTRIIRTRGVEVNQLGSDVANFQSPADTVITLIAGATGIPKRLLVGSERGELASTQDRENFRDMVNGRQTNFAAPKIVRQFADRLIEYGYLPKPKEYKVKWPTIEVMSETEKSAGAQSWASVNQTNGSKVFTDEEIRDKWAGLKPLTEKQKKQIEEEQAKKLEEQTALIQAKDPPEAKAKIDKKKKKGFPRAAEAVEEDDEMVRVLAEAIEAGAHDVVAEIIGLGGPGSGNFGHAGRPGQIGGSASGSFSEGSRVTVSTKHWDKSLHGKSGTVKTSTTSAEGKPTHWVKIDDSRGQFIHADELDGVDDQGLGDLRKAIARSSATPVSISYDDDGAMQVSGPHDVLRDHQREAESRGFSTFLEKGSTKLWIEPKAPKTLGGAGSGNFGHAGRPGVVGGSSTNAARAKFNQMKGEWSRVNDELFKYVDNPTHPEAKALIASQKAIVKEIHELEADPGGLEGVGLPGGAKDVVVIGAGPGGYAAAVMGGAEGLDTLLVEQNPQGGGQSRFSSRVENLPGFPAGVTGDRLAADMHDQAERMGAELRYGVGAVGIDDDPKTGLKTVTLSDGTQVQTRTVVIAGGVQFKRAGFEGADDPSVTYGDSRSLARMGAGKDVVVAGGSNGAAQAALLAAQSARNVSLISRKPIDVSMSDYQVHALRNHPKITLIEGDEISSLSGGQMQLKSGRSVSAGATGIFFGGAPQTNWLPKAIRRETTGKVITNDRMETDIPGVFAIGDVRSGSIGRIGMAIGDGQFATHGIFRYFERRRAEGAP